MTLLAYSELPSAAPILFFDSGIGGLSVLSMMQKALPNAPIVYAADFAFLPYGTKSEIEIATRVPALLGRLVERYRPQLIVIACNTACTIALSHVRAALDVPIVGTVPAIKPAAEQSRSKVIGLLGTAATIRQPYVDRLQADHAPDCTLLRHAAPGLVLAAEAKLRGEAVDRRNIYDAVAGLFAQEQAALLDVIILGCTHFPLLNDEIKEVAVSDFGANPALSLIDGAAGITRRIKVLTRDRVWPDRGADKGAGTLQTGIFVATGSPELVTAYIPTLARYGLTQMESL